MQQASPELLSGLNDAQAEAVQTTTGPLLINAGPGSGKTLALTRRHAYILETEDVPASRTCAVTFTNKAALEMKLRLRALIGDEAASATMGTFHSLCARILRQSGEHIGVPPQFVIYDETDTRQSIKRIIKNLTGETADPGQTDEAMRMISNAKNVGETSAQCALDSENRDIYAAYEEILWRSDALDFDDLLLRTMLLMDNSPPIAEALAERYAFVMVDEFQDASAMQYRIAARLAAVHGNICVVGDPDQSIYGWRQSDIRNFLTFRSEFPNTAEIMLTTNYRSSANVIKTASALMTHAEYPQGYGRKKLTGVKPTGDAVTFSEADDEDDEAEMIIAKARELDGTYALSEMAVCYRTNAQSRALEAACNNADMPYRVVGGPKFYQRTEIKDILSYLRLIANPHDDMSFLRIVNTPRRGIGARSLSRVMDTARSAGVSAYTVAEDQNALSEAGLPTRAANSLAEFTGTISYIDDLMNEKQATLGEITRQLIFQTGYREYIQSGTDDRANDRIENIEELLAQTDLATGKTPRAALGEFIERVSLDSDEPGPHAENDRLTLTTIHQTKGMEWPVVLVAGLNEGTLPHSRSLEDEDVEEERRLCYVAATRAMDTLHLFRPLTRRITGREPQKISRFVAEMKLAVPTTRRARGGNRPRATRAWPQRTAAKTAIR